MKLDIRTKALIGLGTSITANCEPCAQRRACLATENGMNELEIVETISLGQIIKKGIAGDIDKFIDQLASSITTSSGLNTGSC